MEYEAATTDPRWTLVKTALDKTGMEMPVLVCSVVVSVATDLTVVAWDALEILDVVDKPDTLPDSERGILESTSFSQYLTSIEKLRIKLKLKLNL